MELELSGHIFEKYSVIKFHLTVTMGAELFHVDWQTDRHYGVDIRFSQLGNAPKNEWVYFQRTMLETGTNMKIYQVKNVLGNKENYRQMG